jgi:hypothetical protein
MVFDKELMFAEDAELTAFESGVVGAPIDLGTRGAGHGRECFIAIVSKAEATATGDPVITFAVDTAEDEAFTSPKTIPLSIAPAGKGDLAKGSVLTAPLPRGVDRFVRLTAESSIALACAGIDAGIVLDVRE